MTVADHNDPTMNTLHERGAAPDPGTDDDVRDIQLRPHHLLQRVRADAQDPASLGSTATQKRFAAA